MPTTTQVDKALAYYRRHFGPITRREIMEAADPRRSWHTLAELQALEAAGIEVRK